MSLVHCRAGLVVALLFLAGCGGNDSRPTYSDSEVKTAFSAEGLNLRDVRGELRSNRGFWIVVFSSPKEAEARANLYENSGALGQPDPIYSAANIVVYTTQRLNRPVAERVEAALTRLSRMSDERGSAQRSTPERSALL
jgi:hypothetical protein